MPDPLYNGRRLSAWLRDGAAEKAQPGYYNGSASSRASASRPAQPGKAHSGVIEADLAIRSLGTNSIPMLLHFMRAHDSGLRLKFLKFAEKLPLLGFHHVPDIEQNFMARGGFLALRWDAAAAVPELIKIFDEHVSTASQWSAASALAYIGQAASSANPNLIRALKNPDRDVRANASLALGGIHADAEMVVPALINALTDADRYVRENSAEALKQFGPAARPFGAGLAKLLVQPHQDVRYAALQLLRDLSVDPAVITGALLAAAKSDDPGVREDAVQALTRHGSTGRNSFANAMSSGMIGPDDFESLGSLTGEPADEESRMVIATLIKALDDPVIAVRMNAAASLATWGKAARDAIPVLISLLDDSDISVHYTAFEALRGVGAPENTSLGELIKDIKSPDRVFNQTTSLWFQYYGSTGETELQKLTNSPDALTSKRAKWVLADVQNAKNQSKATLPARFGPSRGRSFLPEDRDSF